MTNKKKFTATNIGIALPNVHSGSFAPALASLILIPTHVFSIGGTFNVTLKVKNSVGVENIINKTVTVKNTPTKLKINSLLLTAYPVTTPSGGGWDSVDGPDMFFIFSSATGTSLLETGRTSNTVQSELPITYSNQFPLTLTSLDSQYLIDLWDYDPLDPNDWMAGYYFTIRNSMPTNGNKYPSTISFQNTNSALKFTLNVEWVL